MAIRLVIVNLTSPAQDITVGDTTGFGKSFTVPAAGVTVNLTSGQYDVAKPQLDNLVTLSKISYQDSSEGGGSSRPNALIARAASTANLASIAGLLTIDTAVVLVAGNVVLLKDQTDPKENGLYIVGIGSAAWTRMVDGSGATVMKPGMLVAITEGTVNGDTVYQLTTNSFVVGTDNIAFALNVSSGATIVDLASNANAKGASLIGIEDAATKITGTNVETALAELALAKSKLVLTTNTNGASLIGVEDSANHITGTNVETALAELALEKYELGLTTSGKGASHIGVYDTATLLAAINVETALAELAAYVPITLADPGTGVAIGVTRSAYVGITIGSAGAETNSLAIPTFIGQRLIISVVACGTGTRAVTAAQTINVAGNTHMTFTAVRQCVVLEAILVAAALKWAVVVADGAALT